jgi:branched-chain amino acid transport system substrate-binding protein
VVAQAVARIHSVNNTALINELHRGTFATVQGPMRWNSLGEPQGQMFLVQWLGGKPLPVYPPGLAVRSPEYPKPGWH